MRKLLLWVTLSRCFSYRDFLDSSSLQQSSGDFGDIEIDRDFRDHGDGDDDQESVRAFAWIGFTDKLQIHKKDAIENVPTPFLSIAGKTQNSPCKVVMYKSAYSSLSSPVNEVKANAVLIVKAQLVQLCKTQLEEFKVPCEALNLHTEEGRWMTLGESAVREDGQEEQDQEVQDDSTDDEADEADEASSSTSDSRVILTMMDAVKTYACMVEEGRDLSSTRTNLHLKHFALTANAKKKAKKLLKFFRKKAGKLANKPRGGVLKRLSKKLAASKLCGAKCKKWRVLLKAAIGDRETKPESCRSFAREQQLVEIKGDPNDRIGSIDLSSLDVAQSARKVTMETASDGLSFLVTNDLMTEVVSKVVLGSQIPSAYADISGSWSDLIKTLESRSRECKVEKVGVFNMQAKIKANGFSLVERFPWKVLFFSRAAIQIHTKHGHGKSYGYDLHGDPEEIDFPCKWMTKAYERGYRPRRRLLPTAVREINFTIPFWNRTMHIPKKLWEPTSGGTMLWIDEEGKLPLPEWMRGMRKLSANSKNAPSWMQSFSDGRSMADYVRYMKQDVRGLHAAEESPQILQALLELGWKPDALVALNTGENNLLMNGQSESIQMSAKMVNTVYPYNKKQASQPTISVDFWRHGGENKLWSVYDYTESYLQSCFGLDITSLTQSNDGHSDPSTRSTSTISLCTNNYAEAVLPNSTQRGRADVMKELIAFFSRGKPEELKVQNAIVKSCYSESDCTGNSCMLPGDCKENEDSPCPVGFGCGCDNTKNQKIFAVSLAASVLNEGTRNYLVFGPKFVAICHGVALVAAPFTGGASLGLSLLCPILAPLFFYGVAPLRSDILIAMIFASVTGGMNSCGCIPLKCSASSRMKSNVCALYHPQEKEMSNEYHFVPPPERKCVPAGPLGGCSLQPCNSTDLSDTKTGWHAQNGKMYGHSVGIYNCKAGDFNASDVTVTSSFDYKSFMEKHPDWKELKRGMVPQVQAPAKLSMMEMWSKGLPEDLQKCMTEKKGFMCRVRARLGFAFNFVVALLGKLVDFLFNVVLGVLKFVRFTLFTVMSFVHKDLAGWRRWGGKCDFASDATSTLELDMPIQDNILGDSLCFQGAEFRPCGEVDLAEYIS
mmetsp:Transcript_61536/g.134727  ORF Transcript_61536/g.134727 Transcript_61536/m.134727 type:complete len:1116 (+) Transcript_61536:94-3441(+)